MEASLNFSQFLDEFIPIQIDFMTRNTRRGVLQNAPTRSLERSPFKLVLGEM
jgi:hypothetical protein